MKLVYSMHIVIGKDLYNFTFETKYIFITFIIRKSREVTGKNKRELLSVFILLFY